MAEDIRKAVEDYVQGGEYDRLEEVLVPRLKELVDNPETSSLPNWAWVLIEYWDHGDEDRLRGDLGKWLKEVDGGHTG